MGGVARGRSRDSQTSIHTCLTVMMIVSQGRDSVEEEITRRRHAAFKFQRRPRDFLSLLQLRTSIRDRSFDQWKEIGTPRAVQTSFPQAVHRRMKDWRLGASLSAVPWSEIDKFRVPVDQKRNFPIGLLAIN